MSEENISFKAIVNRCCYTECTSGYSVLHTKSTNMYGIHYVSKCSNIYYIDDNKKIKLNKGFIYFFPANIEFRLRYEADRPDNHYNIYWMSLLARPGLCNSIIEYNLDKNITLRAAIPLFQALTDTNFIKDKRQYVHILNNFASTMISIMNDSRPFKKIEDTQIEKIIFYIYQNLDSDLTVEKLTKIALLNRSYFYKKFTDQLNITPHKYVTEMKMLRAKELLNVGYKVSMISKDLGFHDEKVFSRAFKNYTGLSPSIYKNACL